MKIKIKKALCVLFAIILVCAGLSACGKSPCYDKITYSDGSSETLDRKKAFRLKVENDVAYEQKYSGSKVEIVDKVKRIHHYNSKATIETKHGWDVSLDADWPSLADLRKGTLIKVTGELDGVSGIRAHTIVIIEEK